MKKATKRNKKKTDFTRYFAEMLREERQKVENPEFIRTIIQQQCHQHI